FRLDSSLALRWAAPKSRWLRPIKSGLFALGCLLEIRLRDSQETLAMMATVMATSDRFRRVCRPPKPDRRRALELLAASHDGFTRALLRAHGFWIEAMVERVPAGLASATAERMVAGNKAIEVARPRITEAGRRTLAGGT